MRLRVLSLVLLSTTLLAQSFTSVRELKNLSPSAIAKLHTIEALNALPGGDWRFHAGDIPHGESPTLDDSSWQSIPAPTDRKTYSKAPKEAVWYRRTIEVPKTLNGYDITGSRIWFQFEADANGPMPQIIYFNGRRVALGDDLEPIVLFDPARPGDKILVAVKLLHTVDEKTFTGVHLRIEPPASTRPNPDDLRTECIVAANLLPALPTPRLDLLPKVEEAIAAIDLKALAAGNQQAFDDSLRNAELLLSPLAPILHQDKIDLAGNSHIDAAWLWPRSETIDVVKRTFTTALQLMNEYPDYTFTQSAAQYSAWIADKYPDLNAQIAQRVKEGRWEIVGGMWVEPDLNLPGGESLVRQLLVGQREFKALYGVTARIGWNPDSFGYNWQLPQIYKRSGMDYFVTQKMHWNDTNTLPFRLFWWQSPDGSKVLTYFPTDYAWTNVNPTRLSADFAESAARNPGLTEHLDLFGVGDHGGGPTRDMLDQADKWIAKSNPNQDLSSRPETAPTQTLSSRPEAAPTQTLSSRPEAAPFAAGAERPAVVSASAAGASLKSEGEGAFRPLSTVSTKGALAPDAALPIIRYSTAQNYFNHVETHLNPNSPTWNYDSIAKGYTPPPAAPNGEVGIPTWNDELYFEYHRGIFTTQAKHKANMRRSETETLNAEKLASLAWLDGAAYPADALTENWKKITFNQFHDLAAGSGIATIYRDAQKDFTEVFNADDLIAQSSTDTIDRHIDTHVKNGVPVLIWNSNAWPLGVGVVRFTVEMPDDADRVYVALDGHPIPSTLVSRNSETHSFELLAMLKNMPALGYTLLDVIPVVPNPPSTRSGLCNGCLPSIPMIKETNVSFEMSDGPLDILISKNNGCIKSIETSDWPLPSKEKQFLAPNGCGNQLQAFADNPKNYDAWNIDPGTLDKAPIIISQLDSIKLVTDGPLRKTIRIERTFNKSHITQDISLDAYSDVFKVETTVDWHETHTLLKAAFPLAATSPKATYEIPYGAIQRPTTRNNSWEKAQFEVPALRWADLGDDHQGVSILNDSKYGYDALGNTLRLTLLRSPTWPDPDADQGLQHFTYEIYPHTGPWQASETVHRGYELNTPLTAQQVSPHTGTLPPTHSFASIDEPNIILSAVKKAEDANGLIFRFYEAAGKPAVTHLHIPPGALYAIETNLMETSIPNAPHLPITNDTLTLTTNPWEIRTLEIIYPAPPK
jgi:alpha-mannosidase